MRLTDTLNVGRKAKLALLCVAAFALGILGVYVVSKSRPRHTSTFQKTGGYDFSENMDTDWSGPKPGERLDLQRFTARDGKKITDAVDGEIFMLAAVDPDCGASWVARDELHDVSRLLAEAGVPYMLVSATTKRSPDDFFNYARSLGVDAPAFMWSSKEPPPESLFTMVIPSHILVRRDGTILRTWPGTTKSKRARFQMVNQIVADTLEVASNQH
jgi:hypothetical protein